MQTLESRNPANNQVVGSVSVSTPAEITEKVHNAHEAKKTWKALGVEKRIAILRPFIELVKKNENELALLISQEIGKTLTQAKNDFVYDYDYLQDFFDNGAHYIQDEITFQKDATVHRVVFEPTGVTACLVPWNFPFSNFYWAVIPNLIVGNTVIFKSSEECPLVGKMLENLFHQLEGLPSGVFSAVYGDGAVGEQLVNQQIDMIWFTGSSAVGKKLAAIAGQKQIKAILEMGGSNPTIVFEDVNIDNIIPKLYNERFFNCGQVCDAMKRLIVHKSKYAEVVQKLADHIAKIKIGDPLNSETELGPLSAFRQRDLLETQIVDAIEKGAHVIIGGKCVEGLSGAYYQPTLLTEIKTDMRVWKEEVFGPVLPIISFESEEEALQLANDTPFGLGAVIYSTDLIRARRLASQIEAGTININDGNHWLPCNPFGGHKASGMGCEHGPHGFQQLCQIKVIAEG
jgi:succinate-semialdehyde dehydrogenase/glutarate-semialdehyde dehydrogenase